MTAIAMLLYPGGTFVDPSTRGYSFFANFFSDLGATRTPSGATNTLSMILFTSALAIVGIGLAVFFVALTQFFRDSRSGPIFPTTGAVLGVIAGLCFVGVAFARTRSGDSHYCDARWRTLRPGVGQALLADRCLGR